uniref:Potassium channel toxin kappa-KTx 1.2 n=1 Tax=Chersonesometrus fulvipes TaxID=141248 RepID=KKX11_CHEFU|nr:RecName: Full=Potassium channel toxin kappa-KTx 1.2; AltName: Full=Kappa-hefutoxin 2; Short=Kappa-HfTx2; Contains: RecName: Full=Potassium channel toxin kappa-KTx 1.1; AltName: Full=Kappa-hefutoxin 1; Short=Kappa-HfTx1 [Chersonesometrus fulvipes]
GHACYRNCWREGNDEETCKERCG